MKRLMIIAVMLASGITAFAQSGLVSEPLVKAMESGKFYMKMNGKQAIEDSEWAAKSVSMTVELASRGGVSMSRTKTDMMEGVALTTDRATYLLNEQSKTWSAQPSAGAFTGGKMTFKRQGKCKVNGKDGWYFDEYRASDGSTFIFYYNSNKVSLLEMKSPDGEGFGVLNLSSFSTYIPKNMYFCLDKTWKKGSGGTSTEEAMAMAGMDRSAMEKQIREAMKGQQLPPGMTIDDMVDMAMQGMGGQSAAPSAPSLPAPPQCSTPWTDSGTPVELAYGQSLPTVSISDIQSVSTPVLASSLKSSKPKGQPRMDREITKEGVAAALEQFIAQTEGKTDAQIEKDILDFNGQINRMLLDNLVTGEMAEMCLARASVYPHPALLTTTGTVLYELEDTKRAEQYFNYAIEIEPRDVAPHYGLMECYLDSNDLGKAEREFNKIIEVTPGGAKDGRALLYRAMFKAQKGDSIAAADDLFESLAAGYFDSNSVQMITSLIMELEKASVATQTDAKVDFKGLLDIVFCESNLNLIRKGITWSRESEMHPKLTPMTFPGPMTGNLEGNAARLRAISDKHSARATKYLDLHGKDRNSPTRDLCWAMGADNMIQNMPDVAEVGLSSDAVKKEAAKSAKAQATVNKARTELAPWRDFSGSYTTLCRAYGKKYGVEFFYVPDARPFWCLFLLDRYYEFLSTWAWAGYGGYDDDAKKFVGFIPESYKMMVIQDEATQKRLQQVDEAMQKRHEKEALATGKACGEAWSKWIDAHPEASEEVTERAYRRIWRPYAILTNVTHPTERLNDVETPEAQEEALHFADYYSAAIKPVMDARWADIDKYSQYFLDPTVSNYFRFLALSDCHSSQDSAYGNAARHGENLTHLREMIERARAQIMEEAYQDRKDAMKDWKDDIQREIDEQNALPENPLFGMISDLHATIETPLGTVKVGFINGKWGMETDTSNAIDLGDLAVSAVRRYYGLLPGANTILDYVGFPKINPANEAKVKKYLTEFAGGKCEEYAAAIMGSGPAAVAMAAMKAKAGKLVTTDSKVNPDEIVRDAAGNIILIKRSRENSVNFNGMFGASQEHIQAGKARLRKDKFSFNAGFFNIDIGQYNKRRKGN